jgi:hypothetical protein
MSKGIVRWEHSDAGASLWDTMSDKTARDGKARLAVFTDVALLRHWPERWSRAFVGSIGDIRVFDMPRGLVEHARFEPETREAFVAMCRQSVGDPPWPVLITDPAATN